MNFYKLKKILFINDDKITQLAIKHIKFEAKIILLTCTLTTDTVSTKLPIVNILKNLLFHSFTNDN